eukprot:CAMPEP_0114575976 /NCGR_PEP_ID=MMETSP0125-20121206/787_1 /TAXON_ID=485358 ORGANISM="Aristerostoma sp., Strain ATCC 50986" /NCGR_SAMPLE_ID=MMETSP0125 /ASSEMBLY_ACC=CAM_ASM_000245 /LENGTH=53 /DNA_ID=CAMNT_0001764127 /DNA_START=1717 /DNA_END=1878 /DNA_ORIENTATION=+
MFKEADEGYRLTPAYGGEGKVVNLEVQEEIMVGGSCCIADPPRKKKIKKKMAM